MCNLFGLSSLKICDREYRFSRPIRWNMIIMLWSAIFLLNIFLNVKQATLCKLRTNLNIATLNIKCYVQFGNVGHDSRCCRSSDGSKISRNQWSFTARQITTHACQYDRKNIFSKHLSMQSVSIYEWHPHFQKLQFIYGYFYCLSFSVRLMPVNFT